MNERRNKAGKSEKSIGANVTSRWVLIYDVVENIQTMMIQSRRMKIAKKLNNDLNYMLLNNCRVNSS